MLKTSLCSQLGIELPIFSAGMGPIAGPELVAAVSNAGGLGVLGCTSMSADEIRQVVRKTYDLTDKPFGVDLILPTRIDQDGTKMSDVADLIPEEHRKAAQDIAEELGVDHAAISPDLDRNALGSSPSK